MNRNLYPRKHSCEDGVLQIYTQWRNKGREGATLIYLYTKALPQLLFWLTIFSHNSKAK